MSDPYSLYQPPVQQFQSELPASQSQSTSKGSSGAATFSKTIVKIILWIGAIIMIIPIIVMVFCLVIFVSGVTIPVLKIMGIETIFLTGFTIINNKGISKKYIPILVFSLVFSLLFLAGQYDVQSFNCPLHTNYNQAMPVLQFFVSIVGFLGFFYNGFILIKKSKN